MVLDKLTYAGNKDNLKLVADKITFIHGDICDHQLVKELFEKYQFEQVVHFAAESHVDNSYPIRALLFRPILSEHLIY